MQQLDDSALLRRFTEDKSEEAFTELVTRHVNKVYSVALRHTRNHHQAEEITQAVFVILAQKAHGLSKKVILSGWLYQTARFTAVTLIRGEVRRARREEAASLQNLNETESDPWPQLAPLLDSAMANLNEADRHAIILRYFDGRSMKEVGAVMGASEDAVKMRVNRAVDKLRGFFIKRGVAVSASILTAALSANSIQAAPTALAKTTTAIALAKGASLTASTSALIKGALKFMAWTKMKTTIVVGTCVLLAAGTSTVFLYNLNKPIQGIPEGWSVLVGKADQWNWADGRINAQSASGDTILASSKIYSDASISVTASTTNRDADIGIRMRNPDNGYFILYVPDNTPWAADNGSHVSLIKRTEGAEVTLGTFKRQGLSQSAKIAVNARGPWIEVRLNDTPVLKVKDTTFSSGFVGLRICGDPTKPCNATFQSLKIR